MSEPVLSTEDEKRPVVGFLRLAGWSDEHIALVVEAHKRGEPFKHTLTIGVDREATKGDGGGPC